MEMRSVFSSNVQAIGYDPDTQQFHVAWKSGKTSVYTQVDPAAANDVMTAPSIGQAINATLKGRYGHRYLDNG